MQPQRLLYLGYYFKKADYAKLARFRRYVHENHGITPAAQWQDAIMSSLKYNISFDDYYLFRFYEKDVAERRKWAGTGTMYEYQKTMNPVDKRKILSDKPSFYKVYAPFIRHKMVLLHELEKDKEKGEQLLANPSGKVVLKPSDGQCGKGIEVWEANDLTPQSLIYRMRKTGNDMAEDFVEQHDRLNALSPSGLNTVRIITQLDREDIVHILGARLRISVDSPVDNLAAGNLVAAIDLESGIVNSPGVYSDITKKEEAVHPVTGERITGFEIPYWLESLQLVQEAALTDTGNRSIGWDVAVTNEGAELIEGNHDWCKLVWQLPVKKGLKSELERFL